MSNEIQKTSPVGIAIPATVGFNIFDPAQFEIMQRVCKMFSSSDLVPELYRASLKPIPANADEKTTAMIQAENQAASTKAMANCMIAVDYAMRLGASPLMVMQNVGIIYGRPAPASKFLIAMINSCGRYETLQFRFTEKGNLGKVDYIEYVWNDRARKKEPVQKTLDGTNIPDVECVAYTTKKGSKEVLESAPVSIRLAVEERWFTKDGSKWQTMPRLMLMYRAASMWANIYAPDLLMGMRTKEEIQDIEDVEFEEVKNQEVAATETNFKETISMEEAAPAPETSTQAPAPAPESAPEASAPEQTEQEQEKPGF